MISTAAVFSSIRLTRFVPGIGTIHDRWASSQASDTCAAVYPSVTPTAVTVSTSARLCSKLPGWKRGYVVPAPRVSASSKSASVCQRPVSMPRPSGA